MSINKLKVAINGFGRIGRLAARIIDEKYFETMVVVAINDLSTAENLAYLYNNDTAYKQASNKMEVVNGALISRPGQIINVFANKEPLQGQWKDVDVVLECTGFFLTKELASLHLFAGAKKVILSAPAKDDDIPTILIGVNSDSLDKKVEIISNASCTTNAITPLLYNMLKELKIITAVGVTVHAITATQNIQDGVSSKDFRSGRAGFSNLIPTKTGAMKSTTKLLPELEGKLELSSLRVPVLGGSIVYMTITTDKEYSIKDINLQISKIANNNPNVIQYSELELVSSDIIGNPHSAIIDGLLTKVTGKQIQIAIWYDNEWGYTNRLVEMIKCF